MVSRDTAKQKGAAVQRSVARYLAEHIWPQATTQGAGTPGRDVLNVPVSIEVKARRDFAPLQWVREARKRYRTPETIEALKTFKLDELPPYAVWCPFGVADDNPEMFMVIRRFDEDTAILRELVELRAWKAQSLPVAVPGPGDPRGFLDAS
jgi:hypothetical protein